MARNLKWLRLQLKEEQRMESRYVILHTHFAIYGHLRDQGHQLACYEASNYERDVPNAILYIKTDHEGFYNSCCHYYGHDFQITELPATFTPPAHYRLRLGADHAVNQMAS
ncbi:MAG: hypothetical protein U5L96_16810 [Owenweeksia sp.]|nr:hypothetical protein [Owenweeksia sp.]